MRVEAWVVHLASIFGLSVGAAWGAATFFPDAVDIYKGFILVVNPNPEIIKVLEAMNVSVISAWIFFIAFCAGVIWGLVITFRRLLIDKRLPVLTLNSRNKDMDEVNKRITSLEIKVGIIKKWIKRKNVQKNNQA